MKEIINKAPRTGQFLALLLVLYLIIAPISFQARELGKKEVRAAVETWVRYVTADARPHAVIERIEPYKVQGEAVAYIVHLLGGGFCLCGADDRILPVYLYSPKGTYDPQDPNYQYILWEIETRVKKMQTAFKQRDAKWFSVQSALAERSLFWQDLIAGSIPKRKEEPERILAEPDSMSLKLTSRWNQRSPYNDQCPVLTQPDEHTIVGCVAMAMSQIMYYWKSPNVGKGDGDVNYEYKWRTNWDEENLAYDPDIEYDCLVGRLEWTPTGGGKLRMNGYWDESLYEFAKSVPDEETYPAIDDYLDALKKLWNRLTYSESDNYTANFGITKYNWSLMKDDHHTNPSDVNDAEVAKLCYHVGVAVGTHYGLKGSGAPGVDIDNALEDHFRYDSDAHDSGRDIGRMTEEIQWLRPLTLRGKMELSESIKVSGKIGHAWVVLGYNKTTDPDRQFLMNLGWFSPPAWYSCDEMYPIDQSQNAHIAPINVKFVGGDDPGDGSPNDPYEDIEEAYFEAPDDAVLIFKTGSVNTFSGSFLIINRPFTLKGRNVIIRKQ